jgi:hypothetical protein
MPYVSARTLNRSKMAGVQTSELDEKLAQSRWDNEIFNAERYSKDELL